MTVHRASRDVRHIINVKDYGVTGNGSIDDYSRINDAITAIGSDERILYFPYGTYYIGTSVATGTNITVKFDRGAIVQDNATAGVTFTINGQLDAGPYQIFNFTGSGGTAFGTGALSVDGRFYPEWWGAVPAGLQGSGTANTAAFQEAAYAAAGRGVLYIPGGTSEYILDTGTVETNTAVILRSNTRVEFAPGATVKCRDSNSLIMFRNEEWDVADPEDENIHFVGNGGIIDGNFRTHASGTFHGNIVLRHVLNCSVKGMILLDCSGPAINLERTGGRVVVDGNFINGDPDELGGTFGCDGGITIQGGPSGNSIRELIITNNIITNTQESININSGDSTQIGKAIFSNNIIDTNQGGTGIDVAGAIKVECVNNIIRRSAAVGIYIHNGDAFNIDSDTFVISNNYISETGYDAATTGLTNGHGIAIGRNYATQTLNKGVVSGNLVVDAGKDGAGFLTAANGIHIDDGVTDLTVNGNTVYSSLENGIGFESEGKDAERIILNNNICNYNGKSGISIKAASNINVVGNTCYANGSTGTNPYGIYLVGTLDDINVSSNVCADIGSGDQDYGIALSNTGTKTNIHILGNTCRDNVVGSMYRVQGQITSGWVDNNIVDDDSQRIQMILGAETPALIAPMMVVNGTSSYSGTIGSGAFRGQKLTAVMNNASNPIGVTITNCNQGDGIIYTFNSLDEYLHLEWTGTEWVVLAQDVRPVFLSSVQSSANTIGVGEDDLMSTTVKRYSYVGNKIISIIGAGTKTGSNGNKTIKLHIGSTAITFHPAANNTNDWRVDADVVLQTSGAQRISVVGYDGTSIYQDYTTASNNLSTGDMTIKITGECAHADDTITQEIFIVKSVVDRA